MAFLWRAALRRPWTVVGLTLLALLWLGLQARHLALQPRIDLLSSADPLSRAERVRQDTFGDDFRLLVALAKPYKEGGVVGEPSLEALLDLHRKLEAVRGVRRISSLVNAPALIASSGTPAGAPVWAGLGPEAKTTLIHRLNASEMEKFMFLPGLWSLTPIYMELDSQVPEASLVRDVVLLAKEIEQDHPGAGQVLVVGPAVVESTLAIHIIEDLSRLVPVVLAVVVIGLLLALRNGPFLLIALLHSAALLVLVLGGMAAAGMSINLVSVLAPVILIPVGVADLLHLFVRLRSGVDAGPGTPTAARMIDSAFGHLEGAMVGTSATTVVGFLGFLLSPVEAIRGFGLIMCAGTTLALLLTFTLDAALLALMFRPLPVAKRNGPRRATCTQRLLLPLTVSPAALRRRSLIAILTCGALTVAGLFALSRVSIEDTWIQNFDPDSRIARDTRLFEGDFLGTNTLALTVSADPSRADASQAAVGVVNELTTALMFDTGIQGALSATLLARSFDPRQREPWTSWPTPSTAELRDALARWQRQGLALPRARMVANQELTQFQIQLFVLNQPYQDLARLLERVAARSEQPAGSGVTVRLGGNLMANVRMVRLAVLGQAYSLGALLALMSILAVSYFRSLRAGMMLVWPMALAILLTYGVLVILRIPYGVAVSMFATLVVGMAVDFGIHLRAALIRNRAASRTCWTRDLAIVVRGIILNGSLWTAGFAVLALSALPANRYLGLLCSTAFGLSTVVSLFLLPTTMIVASMSRPRLPSRARGPLAS